MEVDVKHNNATKKERNNKLHTLFEPGRNFSSNNVSLDGVDQVWYKTECEIMCSVMLRNQKTSVTFFSPFGV